MKPRTDTRTILSALVQFMLDGQQTVKWSKQERRLLTGLRTEASRIAPSKFHVLKIHRS